MPFLEEEEWEKLPTTHETMEEILQYRKEQNCDLMTARQFAETHQMKIFEEITGKAWVHFDVISHHRLSDWGPECAHCGNLLRSPRDAFCAVCGVRVHEKDTMFARALRKLRQYFRSPRNGDNA